jgi:hypothetical protein
MEGIHAQHGFPGGAVVPLKPQSPLFGKDIIIFDSLNVNQNDVVICSAFNGWLYAIVTYYDSVASKPGLSLMQSVDNGMTWAYLYGKVSPVTGVKFRSNSIVALGDSVSALKIFWATIYSDSLSSLGQGFVYRFNGITGNYETQLFSYNGLSSIALSSDYNYQASGSSYPTLGMVCSTPTQIAFHCSSNGGVSFNNSQIVATTSNLYFQKVALNYGRSPSWSTGRYFVAWEAQASQLSTSGHVYTAHTEPDFNSAFTTPVCLDSIDPTLINKVRNPVIACQFSGSDNDSSNLTEVIMLEKELSSVNYDIGGFYNLQATTSNHFTEFSISTSPNNKSEPDINFNPFDSTFMLTYYNSTLHTLPFLTNDVNLANPYVWNTVSSAYNDNGNLVSPLPKVKLNYLEQSGMDAWISVESNGSGVALFDAPYSTYTGVSEINSGSPGRVTGVYPNPCNSDITVYFEMQTTGKVTISIYSLVGQTEGIITNQNYPSGKHQLKYNVSNLSPGTYIYTFKSGDFLTSGKFTVIR